MSANSNRRLGFRALGLVLGLAVVSFQPVAGQSGAAPSSDEIATRADAAFTASDWPAAVAAYRELAAADPSSAIARYREGVALLNLGELPASLAAFDAAERLGWSAAIVAYRRASVHAAAGRLDDAAQALDAAAAAGFSQVALLDSDPFLARLRADARWPQVRARVDRVVHPCQYDAPFRAFDFWLGTWDVRPSNAPSSPPSENVVTLEYGRCVVHEHWRSLSSTGESFNTYDASRGKWYQTWVDDTGGLHHYEGNPDAEGNMRFTAELPSTPGGPRQPTRLTFFRLGPDHVRQLSEATADGGKTWTVNYDLDYRRRPGTAGRLGPDAEVAAVLERYRLAWLAGDPDGVLATFADDAALVPPNQRAAIVGRDAIRGYWWPSGPPTTIDSFAQQVDDVQLAGDLAYARGSSAVAWTTGTGASAAKGASRSLWLAVLRRTEAGWRIQQQAWTVAPAE